MISCLWENGLAAKEDPPLAFQKNTARPLIALLFDEYNRRDEDYPFENRQCPSFFDRLYHRRMRWV